MASTILLKKSSTSGSAPTTTDLQAGEIAINLADRKIYVEDGSGAIVTMGVYVDATAPANPVEGDVWYDTSNNLLKAHNGTSFAEVSPSNLHAVAISGSYNDLGDKPFIPTDNASLANGAGYITDYDPTEADITEHEAALTITESQISDLQSYITGYTVTEGDVTGHQAALSITESQISDLQTYALPADIITSTTNMTEGDKLYFTTARAQGAFTASTGVDITAGAVSIGQDVSTTANVTFNNIIADGNLTVNGTVTAVNSTEVNIGDNTIVLNSGETGTPSLDSGFEVERGTASNVSFLWDEANDEFTVGSEKLKAGTLEGLVDGGSY